MINEYWHTDLQCKKSKRSNIRSYEGKDDKSGLDASLYMATKEIGVKHDSLLQLDKGLSAFAIALTEDQVNAKYDEHRRRCEEREGMTSTITRQNNLSGFITKDANSWNKHEPNKILSNNQIRSDNSAKNIIDRFESMNIESESSESENDNESGNEVKIGMKDQEIMEKIEDNQEESYEIVAKDVTIMQEAFLSSKKVFSSSFGCIKTGKGNLKKIIFKHVAGFVQSDMYYMVTITDGVVLSKNKLGCRCRAELALIGDKPLCIMLYPHSHSRCLITEYYYYSIVYYYYWDCYK